MIRAAPQRPSQRARTFPIAALLLCLPIACLRQDPVLLRANSGNFDWLGPPPPLPDEPFAVNKDLDRTPVCGDEFLEPTLRVDVPWSGGARISHLMNFRCGQTPTLDVRVRDHHVIQFVESVTGKPGECKCSQAVHASISLYSGMWTLEIIRADQRRILARERIHVISDRYQEE